jgi:hypothetical protein
LWYRAELWWDTGVSEVRDASIVRVKMEATWTYEASVSSRSAVRRDGPQKLDMKYSVDRSPFPCFERE